MPGVCYHHRAVQSLALNNRVTVKDFLQDYRSDGGPQGDHSGRTYFSTVQNQSDLAYSAGHQVGCHHDQHQADDQCCERLELPVSVVVILVSALGRDLHEDNHYNIAQKI